MKIAFDVDVLAKQMDINRMVHQVADWGYKYIEQSLESAQSGYSVFPRIRKSSEASVNAVFSFSALSRNSSVVCG